MYALEQFVPWDAKKLNQLEVIEMKDEGEHQYFLHVILSPDERERVVKGFLWAKAYHHLGEFICLLFEFLGEDSIGLERFFAYIKEALTELEEKRYLLRENDANWHVERACAKNLQNACKKKKILETIFFYLS